MSERKLIVVLGPTASGKTKFAVRLAHEIGSEIISADSRQVYKGMNIGTGKDYPDYVINGQQVPAHLIDIVDAGFEYDLSHYLKDFSEVFKAIEAKQIVPILCGGSGMYIEAVVKGFTLPTIPNNIKLREELDQLNHDQLKKIYTSLPVHNYTNLADLSTKKRAIRAIEISTYLNGVAIEKTEEKKIVPLIFGLNPQVDKRRALIEQRLHMRIDEGMIEEVEDLMGHISSEKLMRYGLEYKFVTEYLLGRYTKEEMITRLTIAIQQFAKRQMTYFRKMERSGLKIHWVDTSDFDWVKVQSLRFMK